MLTHADARFTRERGELELALDIHAARTARIWAGTTGIVGVLAMALAALVCDGPGLYLGAWPLAFLLGSWPAMGVAYAVGRRVGVLPLGSGERAVLRARARADDLEERATARPLIAVGLLAPLTWMHLACLSVRVVSPYDLWWVRGCLLMVAYTHVVLALQHWLFGARASLHSSAELLQRRFGLRQLGITVLASAVPGALLLVVPAVVRAFGRYFGDVSGETSLLLVFAPTVTAVVNALVLAPLHFWMTGTVAAERRAIIDR
jgi:hypothetical protein